MKKIITILASCIILAFVLSLFSNNSADKNTPASEGNPSGITFRAKISTDKNTPISKDIPPQTTSKVETSADKSEKLTDREPSNPITPDDSSLTTEEFEQLSKEDQDKIIEEFVEDFWEDELSVSEQTAPEEKRISLDIFARPYMRTLTEREFWKLSPEDQKKAMAETIESCRENRAYIKDIIAQAQDSISNNDNMRAEAYLISGLDTGRELCANKNGMLISRVVGIACQKDALNEMVTLYTKVGDYSKVQATQGQLQDIEIEMNEMRETAQEFTPKE